MALLHRCALNHGKGREMPLTQEEIDGCFDQMSRALDERTPSSSYSRSHYERAYRQAREKLLNELDEETRTFVVLAENEQRRAFIELLQDQFKGS